MKRPTRWLLIILVITIALSITACQRATPAPTPTPLPPPPTAFTFPTRPPASSQGTPTPASAPVSVEESTSLSTNEASAEAAATPTPTPEQKTSPQKDVVGWAYVTPLRMSLLSDPGGKAITSLAGGDRLDILGASPDRTWLYVRYQPDEENAEPVTGWALASSVRTFMDLADIPVVGAEGESEETAAAPSLTPVGAATVQARRLNMRAEPGVNQPIIGKLSSGQQVTLLGRSDNSQWLKIQTEDGEIGWAAAAWLKSDAPIKELPVVGKATSAAPKPVAPKGKIVFMDRPGGDIYVMNADGSNLKKITTGMDPAFSPDGRQIAFVRWEGDGDNVRIINVDGSNEHYFVGANKPRSPTWSPDGQDIVFERLIKDKICRITPQGCLTDEQIREMFHGNDCVTYPFPIGVICIWDFSRVHMQVTDLQKYSKRGGNVETLSTLNIVHSPRYHPTEPEVLHLTRVGMSVAFPDEDRPPEPIALYDAFGPPIYSPDGRFIYVSRKDGDSWNIWRYNADGSGPMALTHPPGLRDRPINNVAPAVSPDGRSIIFLSDRNGPWQVWIMNSDGRNQRLFLPHVFKNIKFEYEIGRARMFDWK